MLERSHLLSLQYNRRESLEIDRIPENICDKDLETKALNILTEIGVTKIQHWQVHACHRLKNKKTTIIRFVTRKFADEALHMRKKLKSINKVNIIN